MKPTASLLVELTLLTAHNLLAEEIGPAPAPAPAPRSFNEACVDSEQPGCTGSARSLDCIADGAHPAHRLQGASFQSDAMTLDDCFRFCRSQREPFKLAAVEDRSQCFCGNQLAPSTRNVPEWCSTLRPPAAPCNASGTCRPESGRCCCSGNSSQACGGFGGADLYDVSAIECRLKRIDAAYCDEELPVEIRAADLVQRATTTEKISMLGRHNRGISRLAVPQFGFGEALHGVNVKTCLSPSGNCSTSFPCGLGTSASFNTSLFHAIGSTIGKEARSLYNVALNGACVADWTPDLNLFRHPVWGRGQEVPSEDPLLSATYGREYILGLQGGATASKNATGLQTVATAKHLVAYDMERSTFGGQTFTRHNFTARVSMRDLISYFAVPFKEAVENSFAHSIMCSYNSISIDNAEAIPACAHSTVLQTLLREQWGFEGLVVSDCGAILDEGPGSSGNGTGHGWCNGSNPDDVMQHCVAASLQAGTDADCPGPAYFDNIAGSLQAGYMKQTDVDTAFERLARTMLRLGVLDGPDYQPYGKLGAGDVDTPDARRLALDAARQAIVLLSNSPVADATAVDSINLEQEELQQNAKPLLPLADNQTLAIIGPHANCTQDFLSNYHGVNTLVDENSPLAALRRRKAKLSSYAPGLSSIEDNDTETPLFREAVAAAADADVAVLFAGLHQVQESENNDRADLGLPGAQHELIKAVVAANPRTVLVLINGGPLAIEWEKQHVPAILECFYGGEYGGQAIVDVLFGTHNPDGRMPVTTYPAEYIKRSPFNMDLRADGGQTYLYYDGTFGSVLWPFGHGLSYTTFEYRDVSRFSTAMMSTAEFGSGAVSHVVEVTNVGNVAGATSVLGFISAVDQPDAPTRQLYAFSKVFLEPGQSQRVELKLPAGTPGAATVGEDGRLRILPGMYIVRVENLQWQHRVHGPALVVE